MKLHERELATNEAECDLRLFLSELQKKHRLTELEEMMVLRKVASNRVDHYLMFQLRFERHGDFSTPAGVAVERDECKG